MKIMALLLMLLSSEAAGQWRLLEADRIALDTWKIENNRNMYFPYNQPGDGGEEWVMGAAFEIDLNIVAYEEWSLYWNNRPFMNTTTAQVREAGWQWEAGIDFSKCAQIYWHHLSDHVLDAEVPGKFPLHNFYGMRVSFYDRERKCWQ